MKPEALTLWTDDQLDEGAPEQEGANGSLIRKFVVPPFTILDSRQAYWQERKRHWIGLGIKGELGRGGNLGGFSAATEEYRNRTGDYSQGPGRTNGQGLGEIMHREYDGDRTGANPGRSNGQDLLHAEHVVPGTEGKYAARAAGDGQEIRGGAGQNSVMFGRENLASARNRPATNPGSKGDTRVELGFGDEYAGGNAWRSHRPTNGHAAIPGGGGANSVRTTRDDSLASKRNPIQGLSATNVQAKAVNCSLDGGSHQGSDVPDGSGTSVFDPVLCEIAYRWFCPPAGHVLDPFAGEATKGIVAAKLGYGYTGIELRHEQVDENTRQAQAIGVAPHWIIGDSARTGDLLPKGQRYDLVFTSPPYYDLEIYSDHEADGSAMQTYGAFMAFYRHVFAQCVARLNPNRFVVVKVGEIRDERGAYRNFVGDNIDVFTDLGLIYYNEAILITPAGSLPVRVGKQFSSGRKLGKSHQNVLVFYSGDPKAIKGEFGDGIVAGAA